MALRRGDVAPAIELPAHDGSVWRSLDGRPAHAGPGRPLLMIFHRHLA